MTENTHDSSRFPHADAEDVRACASLMYETDSTVLELLRIVREEADERQRSDAFAALSARYRPLTAGLISALTAGADLPTESDRQELEAEASIALYHASMLYRAPTHATFGYFARVCIRNRLISFLRKQNREQRIRCQPLTEEGSLPEHDSSAPTELTVGDVGEQIAQQDAFRRIFDRFLSSLTPYERRVFDRYIRGMPYRQIAQALSVPEKSVDNAVYRIRVKLKQQLLSQ